MMRHSNKGMPPLSRKYHCCRHPGSNEKQNAPKNNPNEPPCRRVVHPEPLTQRQKTRSTGIVPLHARDRTSGILTNYRRALLPSQFSLPFSIKLCLERAPQSLGDSLMAKKSKRRSWTAADVRELKSAARKKTPARKLAKVLKRTEGATRQKAFSLGLSLDSRA